MTPEARAVWASFEFRVPMLLRNVEPLTESQIRWRPGPGRNSIRWQLWHIAEVEDNWVRTCLLRDEPHYPFVTSLADADLEHDSPRKSDLLEYLQQVRTLTKKRLEALSAEDFEATTKDPDFGELTVRQLWAGVATSFAWHAGQVALTAKLLPDTPVSTWTFTGWSDGGRG